MNTQLQAGDSTLTLRITRAPPNGRVGNLNYMRFDLLPRPLVLYLHEASLSAEAGARMFIVFFLISIERICVLSQRCFEYCSHHY